MENGVVLYLEDTEYGVRIVGQIIGKPDQSKELADEILFELMGDPTPCFTSAVH